MKQNAREYENKSGQTSIHEFAIIPRERQTGFPSYLSFSAYPEVGLNIRVIDILWGCVRLSAIVARIIERLLAYGAGILIN